jgi:hypothetical protein
VCMRPRGVSDSVCVCVREQHVCMRPRSVSERMRVARVVGLQVPHNKTRNSKPGTCVCVPQVVGLEAPHIFLASPKDSSSSAMQVTAPVMRDFVGMECADAETRRMLLEFSYHMTLGNMDEAYKSVSDEFRV